MGHEPEKPEAYTSEPATSEHGAQDIVDDEGDDQ